jgi:hypothetical protein
VINRLILLFFLFFSLNSAAQQIVPQAAFQKDSIAIGEEVPYALWIRYPREQDVIFPDSLYDFSPFEINHREYFTTRTDSTLSLDSVVYFLSTFEIDTFQYLQLPIYLIDEFDSIELLPARDSIVLKHVVETIPDSVAVIVNTEYQKVPLAFNYPYFTAAVIIVLIVVLVIFLAFGNKIRKMLQVFWLGRQHKRFIGSFTVLIQARNIEVEKSIATWKKYLERLEQQPYAKLTTKEIHRILDDSRLRESLDLIDRYIYTTREKPDTRKAFEFLQEFAVIRYHAKIDQIKNG